MRHVAHVETSLLARMVASELRAPARLVLLALIASPATTGLGVAESGSDHLAALTGQPMSSVRRALAELEERQFLIRDLSTGELFVPAVVAGFDAARRDNEETPLRHWWYDTGFDSDPELRELPIASDQIRAAAAAALRRVAT
jgi:hypothetical protein